MPVLWVMLPVTWSLDTVFFPSTSFQNGMRHLLCARNNTCVRSVGGASYVYNIHHCLRKHWNIRYLSDIMTHVFKTVSRRIKKTDRQTGNVRKELSCCMVKSLK